MKKKRKSVILIPLILVIILAAGAAAWYFLPYLRMKKFFSTDRTYTFEVQVNASMTTTDDSEKSSLISSLVNDTKTITGEYADGKLHIVGQNAGGEKNLEVYRNEDGTYVINLQPLMGHYVDQLTELTGLPITSLYNKLFSGADLYVTDEVLEKLVGIVVLTGTEDISNLQELEDLMNLETESDSYLKRTTSETWSEQVREMRFIQRKFNDDQIVWFGFKSNGKNDMAMYLQTSLNNGISVEAYADSVKADQEGVTVDIPDTVDEEVSSLIDKLISVAGSVQNSENDQSSSAGSDTGSGLDAYIEQFQDMIGNLFGNSSGQ